MKKKYGISDHLLNILYPRHCPVCHRILKDQKMMICPECTGIFRPVSENYCLKCGRPVDPNAEYCRDCLERDRIFDEGRGVFLYDGRMRKSLIRYKYYGCREYADYYADSMCRRGYTDIRRWKPDLIIPVPLHRRKLRRRGFNQAGYLAVRMGECLGIPVSENSLKKIRSTQSQKKLDAVQRRKNLRQAFQATENFEGLAVLLVDDVYTTGGTMEAAASCLKAAGARKVYFMTLCMGRV